MKTWDPGAIRFLLQKFEGNKTELGRALGLPNPYSTIYRWVDKGQKPNLLSQEKLEEFVHDHYPHFWEDYAGGAGGQS